MDDKQNLIVNDENAGDGVTTTLLHNDASPTKTKFTLYKSRYVMLAILVLLQVSNAMIWISFAPIIKAAETYYDTSAFMIDFQSMIFMIISIPFGFLGTYVLSTFGLKAGIFIACILNAVGACVRFGGDFSDIPHTRLIIVTIGQGIAAVAQPIFLDSPTLLAATWFGEHERAEANMVASIANPVGIAVGSLVSGLMVTSDTDFGAIRWMLLVNAAVGAFVLLCTLLFFKNKPPTPPSHSAEEKHLTFMEGLRQLVVNPAYWCLVVGFGIGIALISTLSSVFAQVTQANGYTSDDASYFSIAMVGVGFVGAGLCGVLVDKTQAFLPIFKASFLGALVGVIMFYFGNKPDHLAMLLGACGLIGFFAFAALPVGLELCVEATFPVNEGLSTGIVWIASQAFSVIFLTSTNALKGEAKYFNGTIPYNYTGNGTLPDGIVEYYDYSNAVLMFMIVTAFAVASVMFMRTEYKRMKSEHPENETETEA